MKLQGWAVAGKSWVALVGSLLTFIIPWIVQISAGLPEPWPAIVGGVVALLTAVGVYHAPYQPAPGRNGTPPKNPWPTS